MAERTRKKKIGMGMFDKWRPKKGLEIDKSGIDAMANNAVESIDKAVKPGSVENLDALSFDLEQTSQGRLAPNENQNGISVGDDGMIKKNPNMLGLSNEEVNKGVKTEMPDMTEEVKKVKVEKSTPDYESMTNEDFLGGLAPISQAEQEERAKRANAIAGIGHLGNTMAALGNVFAVGAGAQSQKNPKLADNDINGYLERGRQQRLQYAQLQQQQKEREQQLAMKQQEMEWKERKADQEYELAKALAPYKENEAMWKAEAAKWGVTGAQADALYKQYKAQYAPTEYENKTRESESKIRANDARTASSYASAENSRASAQAKRAEAKRKEDANYHYFNSDSEGEIRVDKRKINANNIAKIHSLTGEPTTKAGSNYTTVNKTMDEMLNDIGRHIDDKPEIIGALRNLQTGSANKNSKTPPGRRSGGGNGNGSKTPPGRR